MDNNFEEIDEMNEIHLVGHRGENVWDAGLFEKWIKLYFGIDSNTSSSITESKAYGQDI